MRVLLLLLLVACDYEEDPCDPAKHVLDLPALDTSGDDFIDNYDYANAWDLMPTAAWGVQHLDAGSYDDCGTRLPTSAVTASSDASATLTANAVGPEEVELRAFLPGDAVVHVANAAGLAAARTLHVEPIASVRLVATELGVPDAFYTGAPFARIMLLDARGQPLVDRSLGVSGDLVRGQRWNELAIAGAPAGDHDVVIEAGGSGWPVTVHLVDGIDAIVSSLGLEPTDVCFHAMRAGEVVGGVPWQIDIDHGYLYRDARANCVSPYQGVDGPATAIVTARALGYSASATIRFAS